MKASGKPPASALDERAVAKIEAGFPEGMTAAQIVESLEQAGVRLSEATFRKWVQLGLLPRSRRVGRKGKHQGSLGLYPPSVVRRIAEIRRRMAEGLTIEDIARFLRHREEIEAIARGLDELWSGFERAIAGGEAPADAEARRETRRLLGEARKSAAELMRRIEVLERRIVTPIVRAARARAFGAGAGGGADELL